MESKKGKNGNDHDFMHEIEPIRGSIFVLSLKLILVIFLFDAFYALVFYFLNIFIGIPLDWHHHLSVLALVLQGIKVLLQFSIILFVILQWTNNIYYLTKKHLVKKQGTFNSKEKIYDFENIRNIAIQKSFLGKIFNYGTIVIRPISFGQEGEDIWLVDIENPQKYELLLKECF